MPVHHDTNTWCPSSDKEIEVFFRQTFLDEC